MHFGSQLARFRELVDSEGHLLGDNFRPVNLKHGRTIFYRSENGLPLERTSESANYEERQTRKRENTTSQTTAIPVLQTTHESSNYGVKIRYIEQSL